MQTAMQQTKEVAKALNIPLNKPQSTKARCWQIPVWSGPGRKQLLTTA